MSLMYNACLTAVSPIFVELCFSFVREIAFIAGKWKEGRIKVELVKQTSVSSSALLLD